jgi:hypothetical protein
MAFYSIVPGYWLLVLHVMIAFYSIDKDIELLVWIIIAFYSIVPGYWFLSIFACYSIDSDFSGSGLFFCFGLFWNRKPDLFTATF